MDKISIALMGKIAQVYENRYRDCWFTMNHLPQIFDIEDFDFPIVNPNATIEEVARRKDNQCNFSILVDEIPEQEMYYQSTGRRLSDTYREIITQLTPISHEIDIKKQERIEELNELFKSNKYENYQTWQEKYDTIKIEVNNLLSAILNSTDLQYKKEQKALYELKEREQTSIKRKWLSEGNKIEIERAIHEKAALQSQGFYPDWEEKLIDFEMAESRGINNNIDYYETTYTPSHIVKERSGWSEVSLNKEEIESLFSNMSEKLQLKNKNNISNNSLNIKSLKAKFANIVIHRPWFEDSLFENRFWELPEYFDMVSDGNDPADGLIPNYLYSMIIVKDVRMDLEESKHNREIIENNTLHAISIGPLLMKKPQMLQNSFQLKSVAKLDNKTMKGSMVQLNPKLLMPKKNPRHFLKTEELQKNRRINKKQLDPSLFAHSVRPNTKVLSTVKSKPKLAMMHAIMVSNIGGKILNDLPKTVLVQGSIESNIGEQLKNIQIVFHSLENSKQITLTSADATFKQGLPHYNFEIRINHPNYHPLKTKIKKQTGQQRFVLNKIVQPQDVVIEKQFEGIQVFGYLCKRVKKSPNPINKSVSSKEDITGTSIEYWAVATYTLEDDAVVELLRFRNMHPSFKIKQVKAKFIIVISKKDALRVSNFLKLFPDATTWIE